MEMSEIKKLFTMIIVLAVLAAIPNLFTDGAHVSDSDLQKFSEQLFSIDSNNAGNLITLDIQKKINYDTITDEAPNKLFYLKKEVFNMPTVSKIIKLYDNYDVNAFHSELVTTEERKEEHHLLESFLNTSVMANTKSFLQSHGLIGKSDAEFKRILEEMWFTLYSRGRNKIGSSAFEHIFLAEMKNDVLTGLHNWLYFSYEEHQGHVNYYGWLKKIGFPKKAGTGVLKLKYAWNNSLKHAGTMFVGTSPEFEMSLYTVCFLARPNDKCHLSIDGKKLYIQTYAFQYKGKSLIGSAYPVI